MNDVSKTIGWAHKSWNPVAGCLNGCPYCYARKIYRRFKKSFEPQIHYERLSEPCKISRPLRIFTCSVSDLWGIGVPAVWRSEIWDIMSACPHHDFLTLTKQPQRIQELEWPQLPENLWLGVTITGNGDEWRADCIRRYEGIKFISFEPLLKKPLLNLKGFDWIILGAMSGPESRKFAPKKEDVEDIVKEAAKHRIPVFVKGNLKWPEKIQNFPIKK